MRKLQQTGEQVNNLPMFSGLSSDRARIKPNQSVSRDLTPNQYII